MTDLHVSIQLRAPPHHGPVGLVAQEHGDPQTLAQRITDQIIAAASDGTIANGGCLFITVQRHIPRPATGTHPQ